MDRFRTMISLMALLGLATLAHAGELVQTVTFDARDIDITKVDGYDRVELRGCPASGPVGAPRLPHVAQALAIPAGATVSGVEVLSADEQELKGAYDVIPAQRPVPLPMPGKTFTAVPPSPDQAIYGRDALYPASQLRALSTGSLCGYRIGHVAIAPLRYNPVTKKLYLSARITFRVRFDENKEQATVPTRYQQELFGRQAKALVANAADVDAFAPRVSSSASKALPAGNYRSVTISGSASFDTVFARLGAWKTRKGLRDTVIDVSAIYAGYTGYDNMEKIRNFIKDAKNTWGTVYVLLAGQGDDLNAAHNLVPSRHAYYTASGGGSYADEDSIPTDWYYSDLDGTWDSNGNHVWGELADNINLYADVFVGRAPVLNVAQAQNFVAKTLNYEKSNPGGYLKKMLLPCAILWSSYEERPTQRAIKAMTPAGWVDDTLFERCSALSPSAMAASMNDGRGLGHWMGHGDENGIYMGSTAYYSSSAADAASNGSKQGVHTSIACFTGAPDEVTGGDGLAEHILNRVGGGAVGMMMNSRYGWGAIAGGVYVMGPDEMTDTTFAHLILTDHVFHQGEVLAMAKNAWVPYADSTNQFDMMRWCIYEKICYGDPALPILTDDPVALTVSHDATVTVGAGDFAVTVSDPAKAPVRGALVCLMTTSGDCYITDTTDASGQVTLHPALAVPGQTMYVTVTARNHTPYEGSALVIAPSGPYVTRLKHTVSDAAGNNDGIVNPGETVRLPMWVINHGVAAANGLTATLRSGGPNGTVTADSVHSYGTIAAGDSAQYPAGFGVYVNPADSNGVTIPLTLECRDDQDSVWTSSFSLTVGTAQLAFDSKAIGGNGRLDPSETAALAVALKNIGIGHGYNTLAVMRCDNPHVAVTDSTAGYGTIGSGATAGSGADSFQVAIDGGITIGTSVTMTVVMKADGVADRSYSWSETVGDQRYSLTPDNTAGTPLYYAVEDSDGCSRAPVYNWTEIRSTGTQLTALGDDDYAAVTLPFTFNWYGTNYTALSVCSNGWISFGSNSSTAYNNTVIPTGTFTAPTIFALWNDLNASSRWVGYYNDAGNGRYIVEYDSIIYYGTTSYNKFQVIYYDSTTTHPYHDVVLQYKLFTDGKGSLSTYYPSVGFQQNGTTGCQMLYNHAYASTALPMGSGRAIRITRWPNGMMGVADQPAAAEALPAVYCLNQAFPNPGHGLVTISYQLPRADRVELAVYNIAGQMVKTLASGERGAGHHSVRWDGRDASGKQVSSGVYLYRLSTPNYTRTGKLSMVR